MNTKTTHIVINLIICVLGFSLLLPPEALAQTGRVPLPGETNYQGLLVDDNGDPLADNDYQVKFRIYDDVGSLLWAEQQVVRVRNGRFNAVLDRGTPIDDAPHNGDLFEALDNGGRYLGLTVIHGGNPAESEIVPRQEFLATPFAGLADIAYGLDDVLRLDEQDQTIVNLNGKLSLRDAANVETGSLSVDGNGDSILSVDKLLDVTTLGVPNFSATTFDVDEVVTIFANKLPEPGVVAGNASLNVRLGHMLDVGGTASEGRISVFDGSGSEQLPGTLVGEQVRLSASNGGNVVIGSSNSLGRKLRIVGGAPADANAGQLSIAADDAVSGKFTLLGTNTSYGFVQTHGSQPLLLNPIGNNVAIGTTNTGDNRLRVAGDLGGSDATTLQHQFQLEVRKAADDKSLAIGVLDNGKGVIQTKEVSNPAYPDLLLNPVDGNVGIGTTNADGNRLRIAGDLGGSDAATLQHQFQLEVRKAADNKALAIGVLDNGKGVIQAKEANNPYPDLLLNPVDGNVGIGEANPQAPLSVGGVIHNTGQGALANAQGNWFNWNALEGGVGKSEFINHRGSGTGGFTFWTTNEGGNANASRLMALNHTGNLTIEGTLTQNSDIRWKTNISTVTNALAKIIEVRGVSYEWNTEKFPGRNFQAGKQIGFIAQEIEKVFPELVATDNDGYKSVSYTSLVPVLVEAMKEMNDELTTAEQRITDQQAQITRLREQADQLPELQSRLSQMEKSVARLEKLLAAKLDIEKTEMLAETE